MVYGIYNELVTGANLNQLITGGLTLHLPVVKGASSNPAITQPTNGNLGHLCSTA
jgi:hypothetical protein